MDPEALKASLLDVVVPQDTTTDLSELLEIYSETTSDTDRLVTIKERDTLFFGEQYQNCLS